MNAPIVDAAAEADSHPPAVPPGGFTCTLILGTNHTAEWYEAGFEKLVDDSRWELIHAHRAFVELWADPNDPVWPGAIGSRCAQGATTPDRIIFLALAGGPDGGLSNYPLDKWLPLLNADVANIRAKYPAVKRIELMSYVRGPKNGTCPGAPGAPHGGLSQPGSSDGDDRGGRPWAGLRGPRVGSAQLRRSHRQRPSPNGRGRDGLGEDDR
jgi:hypothetical protein